MDIHFPRYISIPEAIRKLKFLEKHADEMPLGNVHDELLELSQELERLAYKIKP